MRMSIFVVAVFLTLNCRVAEGQQRQKMPPALAGEGVIINIADEPTVAVPGVEACGKFFFSAGAETRNELILFIAIHGATDRALHMIEASRLEVHVWNGPSVSRVRPKELPERPNIPALRIDVSADTFKSSPCLARTIVRLHV